ncbi:hypothetical protein J8273_4403 [Carpediemonas membranifera]|uniref:RING-type domain-containing protein n=1 Tax=Carpediemonas membranifera TaxID=201153 RepID=A0A8J6AW79_9EUKA|nr:hypothetical protein J8273_4403 [Carpediemonas membranifera]|eukprot:KAG9394040.1 hypothetical protein J8273_4403 [Carpediemonas membranifera]
MTRHALIVHPSLPSVTASVARPRVGRVEMDDKAPQCALCKLLDTKNGDERVCVICLAPLGADSATLRCSCHCNLHGSCARQALAHRHQCPICREPVSSFLLDGKVHVVSLVEAAESTPQSFQPSSFSFESIILDAANLKDRAVRFAHRVRQNSRRRSSFGSTIAVRDHLEGLVSLLEDASQTMLLHGEPISDATYTSLLHDTQLLAELMDDLESDAVSDEAVARVLGDLDVPVVIYGDEDDEEDYEDEYDRYY